MKPTSRNNGHLRSDDGQTHTQTDFKSTYYYPLIIVKMEEDISHWDIFLQTRRTEKAEKENIWKKKIIFRKKKTEK